MRHYKPSDTEYERLREKALSDLVTECLMGEKIGRGRRTTWLAEIIAERLNSTDPDAQHDCDDVATTFAAFVINPLDSLEARKVAERIVGDWCDRHGLTEERVREILEYEESEAAEAKMDEMRLNRRAS